MIRKLMSSKILSLAISSALISTSIAEPVRAAMAVASPLPEFVRTLTPPSRLGFLENYFQGQTKKPVILIQDLHCNYGVQKKIFGILEFLQPKVSSSKPMILGIEAAWKEVDVAYTKKYASRVRAKVDDYLMKEGEMSGMQHFAILSEKPVKLVGIDDELKYQVHGALIRKSAAVRLRLANKVEEMDLALARARKQAPQSVQKIWKLEEVFQKGEIGLRELARELQVPSIANYGEAESLIYKRKMALAQELGADKGAAVQNLVRADESLKLFSRLLRQQMTLEEVQFAAHQLKEMLAVIQALFPGDKMDEWEQAIRSAISYYAVALVRDQPLAQNTVKLVNQNPDSSVVAVTGGFHTAGITKILREKKISYVVIAPMVESHTTHDEVLYLRKELGDHLTPRQVAEAMKATRTLAPAAHTFGVRPAEPAVVESGLQAETDGTLPPGGTAALGVLSLTQRIINGKTSRVALEDAINANGGNAIFMQGSELSAFLKSSDTSVEYFLSEETAGGPKSIANGSSQKVTPHIGFFDTYQIAFVPHSGLTPTVDITRLKVPAAGTYSYDGAGLTKDGSAVEPDDMIHQGIEFAWGALSLAKGMTGKSFSDIGPFRLVIDPKVTAYTDHKTADGIPVIHMPLVSQELINFFLLRELPNVVLHRDLNSTPVDDYRSREDISMPLFVDSLAASDVARRAVISALRTAGLGFQPLLQLVEKIEDETYTPADIEIYVEEAWQLFGARLEGRVPRGATLALGTLEPGDMDNRLAAVSEKLGDDFVTRMMAQATAVKAEIGETVTALEGLVGKNPNAEQLAKIAEEAEAAKTEALFISA